MRILLIANTLPPIDISGVGEQVLQLAAGLERRGHRVEVLSRTPRGLGSVKLLFPLTVAVRVLRHLHRFRPHVVQVHESDGALAAFVAATVRHLSGTPQLLVGLLQVSYAEEWRAVRALRFDGRVLGRPGTTELRFKWMRAPLLLVLGYLTAYLCDVVLAPSRRTARELERDYRVASVGVLPNVMGGRTVDEATPAGLGDIDGCLLYVGRLRVRKAVEVLLESLARLPADTPPLLVVGDGEHLERLRRQAGRIGLGSRVRFLGRRSPGEVRDLMRRALALVVPSIYEGMPLVVLEAMERSLPVVATAVSGIPEVVEDGVSGWLVPSEDPVALAEALRQVAAAPEEARRRGEAGRRIVTERYGVDGAAERWERTLVESGLRVGPQSAPTSAGQDNVSTEDRRR